MNVISELSPGVSRCRGCRAVSGGVEAVSRQCRLTPVSVCRAVSGCSVGAVSGLLDSGDVRVVSRCQAVSECRSVGVSGCRSGVEVSECRCPTQTASILSQSCKFRFLKSNSTFTTTYGRQPLAVACSCSVGRLAVARRGGGVHHGDGDGQAVVQEKAQHLQPSLRGRSTRKSRRASWPGARRARRCSRKATVSNGSLKSCRTCESGGRSRGGGSSTGCSTKQHRRWQRQGLRGPERGAEVQDVGDGEARVEGVGGVSGVSRVSGVSEVSSVGSVGSVEMP